MAVVDATASHTHAVSPPAPNAPRLTRLARLEDDSM